MLDIDECTYSATTRLCVLQRVCECASVGTRRVLCDVVRPLLRDDTLLHATEYVMDMLAADSRQFFLTFTIKNK